MRKIIISVFSVVSLVCCNFAGVVGSNAAVTPPSVSETLMIGESITIEKTVTTPEIPSKIDVCLLEDETESFSDDIGNLQGGTTASDIYDTVIAMSPGAHFAVAGFRDYPVSPHGSPGDWVYRLLSPMSSAKASWLTGIAALTAGGGLDLPEAQYDAIVEATEGIDNCGWRDVSVGAKRVLVVTTDASFHLPGAGKPHINTQATAVAALSAQNITVIGLKAPGAGGELDALATATGGSVQPLSSSGSDIADAILAGLGNLPVTVTPVPVGCDPLIVTFVPPSQTVISGDAAIFDETITVPNDPTLGGTVQICVVEFRDENENVLGVQEIEITIPDTTPPTVSCVETVNPSGKKIPPAGSTTPPGNKGGQNDDGFYQLIGEDAIDSDVEVCVMDEESGVLLGCYASGTNVKYTEVASTPRVKAWGSAKSFVEWHLFGNGDMVIYATDSAGNVSDYVTCLVPPFPK